MLKPGKLAVIAAGEGFIFNLFRTWKNKAASDCYVVGKAGRSAGSLWGRVLRVMGMRQTFYLPGRLFLPAPGHPVTLEAASPGAELGPAACKPPAARPTPAASPPALAGPTAKPRLVSASQGHAPKPKRAARRETVQGVPQAAREWAAL